MALSFKALSVFLALSTLVAHEGVAPNSDKALQADVCEMLRDSHEEIHLRYPNEYYDCTAHGRFFKDASLAPSAVRPFHG